MGKVLLKRVFFIALGTLSLVYIYYILHNSINNIGNIYKYISVKNVFLALVPSLLMLMTKSYFHTLIIEDIKGTKINNKLHVFSIYSNAQVIRYLPGKIWGVLYQSEQLSHQIPKGTTWLANILQMLVTNINSIIVLGTIYLSLYFNGIFGIVCFILSTSILFILIKKNILTQLINTFSGNRLKIKLGSGSLSTSRAWLEIVLLQLDWIFYFSVWYLIAPSHLSSIEFTMIGATYAAASFIGMLAFVMPSGWFVREASFIWLGGIAGLSQNLLLIYSIIARVFFILADLCWALILAIFSSTNTRVRVQ